MWDHWISILLCVTALFVSPCICSLGPSSCRCRPRDPCWPTVTEWSAFNRSVNGHLQRVRPVGYVCHGDNYDQASCDAVKANDKQCLWRISQPGALIDTNWESLPEENEECYVHSPENIPCKQGRIPLYAVIAETIEEVQAAVRFARARNLRIVVRNTGHGVWRSSGPDSLQINLSKLKHISHTMDFIPQGGTESLGQAVTLGAATLAYEISNAGAKDGYIVLVGTCSTVGIAGGFLQGGGVSYLAPIYGTPADNALEFVVVTAKGDLVVANNFQHQDLFWALRGGGGGTFGIAVSTTVRAYPDVSAVDVWVNVTGPSNSTEAIWTATREILRMYPALNDKKHTAIVGVVPNPFPGYPAGVYLTSRALDATTASVNAKYAPLLARLDALGIKYRYSATFHPSLATLVAQLESIDIAGDGVIEGSIFVSEALHKAPDGPERLVDILSRSHFGPGDDAGILLTGGKVKDNRGVVDTASRPSWRDALSLVWVRWRMSSSPSPAEQRAYGWNMTMVQMPLLRSLEDRDMGTYLNIADPNEPNFQHEYWGEDYARLWRVKREWDGDGMFIVKHGVGSEEWDEEGLCRVR